MITTIREWCRWAVFVGLLWCGSRSLGAASPEFQAIAAPDSIWSSSIGEGFKRGAKELLLSGGAGYGVAAMGTRQNHHWWLTTLDVGYMVTGVVGRDHWYAGNLELVGEVFGGEQFHPDNAYFVGVGPHFRYHVVTGTRFVPFADVGLGFSATDIRNGDLSTTMEFNLQAGGGLRIFISDTVSLALQWRFIHLSNAGAQYPNLGVNNLSGLLGMSWGF